MNIITTKAELRAAVRERGGETTGFVPTMGYLHEGHVSLMRRGRAECDFLVASIFVNPTQFAPGEDLDHYPRDEEGDAEKCRAVGVDLLWIPPRPEVYAPGHATTVQVDRITRHLCGASRPIHFDGVATVVTKLFNLVRPDRAYFGEKDYQQLAVVRRLVVDLDFDVEIIGCPTVREDDGVAMSSRNANLSPEERRDARALSQGLARAREACLAGERSAGRLQAILSSAIEATDTLTVDYATIFDSETLELFDGADLPEGRPIHAAVAAQAERARLIDNARLDEARDDGLPSPGP